MRATQNSNGMSVAEGWKRLGAQSEFTLHQRSWIEPTIDWTLSCNQPRLGSGQVAANLPLLATGTPSPITHTHFPGQWKQAFSDSLPAHTVYQKVSPTLQFGKSQKFLQMAKICKTFCCTLKVSSIQIHIILLCGLGKKKFLIAHKTQLREQRTVAMDFYIFLKINWKKQVEIVKIISKNKCSEGWLLALTSC